MTVHRKGALLALLMPAMRPLCSFSCPTFSVLQYMAQILRFNSTDERITYDNNWKIISDPGERQNETYSLATTPTAQFYFLFRGMVHP